MNVRHGMPHIHCAIFMTENIGSSLAPLHEKSPAGPAYASFHYYQGALVFLFFVLSSGIIETVPKID